MAKYDLRASDIMQVEVATILEDATITEAVAHMRMEGVRSLIIERLNEADPYGIITYWDIVAKVLAEGKDPDKVQVSDIMTKPVISIPPNLEIKYIARLLRQSRIGHVPVIENNRLIGIVSRTDLVVEVITEPVN
jgi:CBS domain-containing protein